MNHITKSQLLCVIAAFTVELAKLTEEGREHRVHAGQLKAAIADLNKILETL